MTKFPDLDDELEVAIWEQDEEKLEELAPCVCCCGEHTHINCEARLWRGCRSGLAPGEDTYDEGGWVKHYAKNHGMTEKVFFGID